MVHFTLNKPYIKSRPNLFTPNPTNSSQLMAHFTLNKPYLESGPNLLHPDQLINHPPNRQPPPPTRPSTQLTDGPNNTSKVDRTSFTPTNLHTPIVHFTLNKLYLKCGPSLLATDQLAHPPISVNRTPFSHPQLHFTHQTPPQKSTKSPKPHHSPPTNLRASTH